MAIKINDLNELQGVKHENYLFSIEGERIKALNSKEKTEIYFDLNTKRRFKTAESIEKHTGLKIELENLSDRELLAFIESKGFSKTLWNPIGKAMHKYNMIEAGDRIAVGVSGGKDSLTTINALVRIKKIVNFDFEIIPIHIHPSTDSSSYNKTEDYCKKMGLELQVFETDLQNLLFEEKKEKNPCFLCGRIRRGMLYRIMKEQNINKLALGHHKDDIIETFLMNVFYQGNMNVMKPAYYSKDYGVMVIRPLSFVEEKNIIKYVRRTNLPILKSECAYETNENSRRLRVKNIITDLSKENSEIRSVMLNSIKDLLD
ncbi:ATP-binding protein [uncultured Ilyobacter sp.]|jgi:tRNA(Ile)-lysidine synthase TilS/MesJ|uniref:tRNA 2-thiocytidine biosynthesis TtcA family protein n=1 Tax=uncultured Ilyobacter sp. TaxID=544433 RepID=UPI002AA877DB|nr:ATP-binding protein [uncultured Ilyobacter sp.]